MRTLWSSCLSNASIPPSNTSWVDEICSLGRYFVTNLSFQVSTRNKDDAVHKSRLIHRGSLHFIPQRRKKHPLLAHIGFSRNLRVRVALEDNARWIRILLNADFLSVKWKHDTMLLSSNASTVYYNTQSGEMMKWFLQGDFVSSSDVQVKKKKKEIETKRMREGEKDRSHAKQP